ncbi:MAG: ATP-binding protein [Anaerolineae bacterium]|nr:ATP-binding protein [Anaerolineae bacterium]MDW8173774.1 ATP-binding protein [Anaerolineae bacterium]
MTTAVPTNTNFATEVKTDRLAILYKTTAVISLIVLVVGLTFGVNATMPAGASSAALTLLLACIALILGCLVAHLLIGRSFLAAAWGYTLGGMASVGILIVQGDATLREIAPFVMPVIVFVAGLMLPSGHTAMVAFIASLTILFAPWPFSGAILWTTHSLVAILLSFLSMLFAVQVTGELYQIADWALQNYNKERQTNDELFEKRAALQKALKRSEALSDSLQAANVELEKARRSAEEAKEFRGKFLANMSHELRTPLNAIIGFSETMLEFPIMYDDVPLPEAYARDLRQIYSSGRQLLHVINDILDLAKVDAGKLEIHLTETDVSSVMKAVMSTAKGLLGKKPVRLEAEIPEPIPTVYVDETRFRQILLNLYSNAVKYTDEGFIKLRAEVQGDELIVHVQDTGLGIDPEFHDKLFREFQQAKTGGRDPRSGSGLGLAISKQLVELMGGRIWMESEVGRGSTFSFSVPLFKGQDNSSKTLDKPPQDLPASPTPSPLVAEGR